MAGDGSHSDRMHPVEASHAALLDGQPEMVCRFRLDGTIVFVNAAYARARGTTPEAMVGHNFWDFIAESDRASVRSMLQRLTPELPEVRIENRFSTAEGERWTLWSNRGLKFDPDGGLLEAQSTGIDITERKRAEQALAVSARRMGALYQLTDRMQRAGLLGEVYEAALDALVQALDCDRAAILLFDAAGVMRFVAWRGLSQAQRDVVEQHASSQPGERDAIRPIGLAGLAQAEPAQDLLAALAVQGIQSAVFVPLLSEERLVGKLMVFHDAQHALTNDEFGVALTIGNQVGFGLQRIRAESERRDAEKRLRASEQELSDFFETAAIGLHWVGVDGTILRANQAELDMLGYASDEYVGRHIADFHVDRGIIEGMLACLRHGEAVRDCVSQMRHKDGSIREVLVNSSVLFENGDFVHTRCFTLDITERTRSAQALAESERSLRLVSDNVPALISYIDKDHYYRFVNARYREWLGVDQDKVNGIHMRDMLGAEVYEGRRPYIERVLKGETVRFESTTPHRAFGYRATDVGYVPHIDRNGVVQGFYVLGFDITERKRTEEALKETDRRKDEFLATLAHELRNPLAPLKNSLHLLHMISPPDARTRAVHEMMERQVNHLVRLVDDLLEMSRISRGALELRPERVELSAIVRNAVETSQPLIERAGHRLDLSLPQRPLWLDGDPVRLAQILSNLLNNAAKYTPAGGRIALHAREHLAEVVVAVEDNGIGIAPEALARIFEMFSRGEHTDEPGDPSLGIGLPLARRLAEMHGGSIEARSQGRGRGAEFLLRLPLAAEQQAAAAAERRDEAVAEQKRVLVVDDNRDAADSLGMLLDALGVHVNVVHNGPDALAAFAHFAPSLVLLDIGMPEMDGYEVARRIRSLFPESRAEIVALTGWGQEEDRRRASAAGFDHHLTKPADIEDLQRLLASDPAAVNNADASTQFRMSIASRRHERKT